MSSSFLSVLIQRQAGKYGDRVALRYRDYKTETWIPVSWNQCAHLFPYWYPHAGKLQPLAQYSSEP